MTDEPVGPPPSEPPAAPPPPPPAEPSPPAEPEKKGPPRGPIARLAGRVDEVIFSVEKAVVTVALLIMTGTVALDIVFRSFAAPPSLALPVLSAVFTFVLGAFLYVSIHRRRKLAWSWGGSALAGLVALVLGSVFVYFVTHVPSKWVCAILLLLGCVSWGMVAQRKGRWGSAFLASLFALGGLYLCTKLRQDYIWSQELSLILLAWVAFIGGSMATREGKHIFVEALSKVVPKSVAPWTCAAGFAVTTAFCAFVVVLAVSHVFGDKGDFASGETRPATGIAAFWITLAPLVAFGLMALRFGATTVDHVVHPRVPEKKELL